MAALNVRTTYTRPLANFSAPGAVTVPAGAQDVTITVPNQYNPEWTELQRLMNLPGGYRVRSTPANGLCGLYAVWIGFHSLCLRNGWAVPTMQALRDFLNSGRPSPLYWSFLFNSHVFDDDFLTEDYDYAEWFSSVQLDLLAEYLGLEYGNRTPIRTVYISQEPNYSNIHMLIPGQLIQRANEQLIYIHYNQGPPGANLEHYSGIGSADLPTPLPILSLPVAPQPAKGRGSDRPRYHQLPSDDDLLYITGQLKANPRTGSGYQIQTPISKNKDLAAMLGIKSEATLSKRMTKARDKRETRIPAAQDTDLMSLRKRLGNEIRDQHPSRDLRHRWPRWLSDPNYFEFIIRPAQAPSAIPVTAPPAIGAPRVPAMITATSTASVAPGAAQLVTLPPTTTQPAPPSAAPPTAPPATGAPTVPAMITATSTASVAPGAVQLVTLPPTTTQPAPPTAQTAAGPHANVNPQLHGLTTAFVAPVAPALLTLPTSAASAATSTAQTTSARPADNDPRLLGIVVNTVNQVNSGGQVNPGDQQQRPPKRSRYATPDSDPGPYFVKRRRTD